MYQLLALTACVILSSLVGCAAHLDAGAQGNFLKSKGKVGVIQRLSSSTRMEFDGIGDYLDNAMAAHEYRSFSSHVSKMQFTELAVPVDDLKISLESKGLDVVMIQKEKEKEKELEAKVKKRGLDYLLIIDTIATGTRIEYYGPVSKNNPRAVATVKLTLEDMKEKKIVWSKVYHREINIADAWAKRDSDPMPALLLLKNNVKALGQHMASDFVKGHPLTLKKNQPPNWGDDSPL